MSDTYSIVRVSKLRYIVAARDNSMNGRINFRIFSGEAFSVDEQSAIDQDGMVPDVERNSVVTKLLPHPEAVQTCLALRYHGLAKSREMWPERFVEE